MTQRELRRQLRSEAPARRSFLELLPTRNLLRAILLLLVLGVIVMFQGRSGDIAAAVGRALFPNVQGTAIQPSARPSPERVIRLAPSLTPSPTATSAGGSR